MCRRALNIEIDGSGAANERVQLRAVLVLGAQTVNNLGRGRTIGRRNERPLKIGLAVTDQRRRHRDNPSRLRQNVISSRRSRGVRDHDHRRANPGREVLGDDLLAQDGIGLTPIRLGVGQTVGGASW